MRALFLAAALLLALPPAAAGAPQAVEGSLAFPEPAVLAGPVAVRVHDGALDLAPLVKAGAPPALRVAGATGRSVETTWATAQGQVSRQVDTDPRDVTLPAGVLRVLACDEGCRVLLVAEGLGRVGLDGEAAGPAGWRGERKAYCGDFCRNESPNDFSYESPAGHALAGADGLVLRDARTAAEGRLRLFVYGALAEHVDEAGTVRVLDQRADRSSTLPGTSLGVVRTRFLNLELDARSLDGSGEGSVLMGPRLLVALEGSLASPRATGALLVDGRPAQLADEPVRLDGRLDLVLHARAPGSLVADAEVPRADLSGEATLVRLGERTVRGIDPAQAAGGGLLVLLLLALAAVGLYSRIRRDRVLENGNRERIVRILRARPGLTSREVAAELGLARVVVQHHLVVLLTHRFVLRQRIGRADRYHATDAPLDARAVERARSLRDPTRRRIAEAIAASGGLSQADVAARAGVSLRLASYHLTRLERVGLVTRQEGSPRRYDAAPALRELSPSAEG